MTSVIFANLREVWLAIPVILYLSAGECLEYFPLLSPCRSTSDTCLFASTIVLAGTVVCR